MTYASKLDAQGHKDWHVPTIGELDVLFNRAAIGRFDVSVSVPAGWYRSSTETSYGNAWGQRFSDGSQGWSFKDAGSSFALRSLA